MSCNTGDHSFFGYWEVIGEISSSNTLRGKEINFRLSSRSTRVSRRTLAWMESNFYSTSREISFGSTICSPFKSSLSTMTSLHPRFGSQNQWLTMRSRSTVQATSLLTFSSVVKPLRLSITWQAFRDCCSDRLRAITSNFVLAVSILWSRWLWIVKVWVSSLSNRNTTKHFSSSLGWCTLTCKRIKKDQSIGQSVQYTLLSAFEEKFFSDVTIKSCDGLLVRIRRNPRTKSFLIPLFFSFSVRSPFSDSTPQRFRLQQPVNDFKCSAHPAVL